MMKSQIWISLSCCSNLVFGGCYAPPVDSDYADDAIFGDMQAKLMNSDRQLPILLGDLNARMWSENALSTQWPNGGGRYVHLADHTVNEQGHKLLQLCKDTNCAIVNHLEQEQRAFQGGLSFKKRSRWISELDVCVAEKRAIPIIQRLHIENDLRLPSDHAPLEIDVDISCATPDYKILISRAAALGTPPLTVVSKKPPKGPPLHRVNVAEFRELMATTPTPILNEDINIDEQVDTFNSTLNIKARQTRAHADRREQWGEQQHRWERLLDSEDHKKIWRAIGWNGCLVNEAEDATPSDDEFKAHFESLLMKNHNAQPLSDADQCPYVPILDDEFSPVEVERAIKSQKNKAFVGVCSGLFKWLPFHWIIYLTRLLSAIFASAAYPDSWTYNTLNSTLQIRIEDKLWELLGYRNNGQYVKVIRQFAEFPAVTLEKESVGQRCVAMFCTSTTERAIFSGREEP